jgi:acyl-CoA thioester hydrolase
MEQPQYPLIGEEHIKMRWGDMDALGHLNNTVYFRFLEQTRLDWLNALGYDIDPNAIGPILAGTSCNFLKPMVYPASVRITIELEKLGRSSLKFRHRFFCEGDEETVYAVADATLVWVDYQAGHSVPLPEPLRTAIEAKVAEN